LNGKPAVLFDGANDFLVVPTLSIAAKTIIVIFKKLRNTSNYDGFFTARASGATKAANSNEAAGFTLSTNSGLTGFGATQVFLNGVSQTVSAFNDYDSGISAALNTTYALQINNSTSVAGSKNFVIGADAFDSIGQRHAQCAIGEILVYDFVLSPAQKAETDAYVQSYWGVSF